MDKQFKKDVKSRAGGENLYYCFSCGSCTASCPISELDDSYNPRLMIKKVLLGMREEVLASEDLWKCVQCHRCVAHCPQNVKFAYVMRVLREMSVEEGHYPASLLQKVGQLDRKMRQGRLDSINEFLEGYKQGEGTVTGSSGGGDKNG